MSEYLRLCKSLEYLVERYGPIVERLRFVMFVYLVDLEWSRFHDGKPYTEARYQRWNRIVATSAPSLIWCADGNPVHSRIAYAAGWLYGVRLPARGMADLPLTFADQNWKKPDRQRYMTALARHRPSLATVLDWEWEVQ